MTPSPEMNEVLPGVLHWTAHHEGIGERVHSHFAVESAALIDPRVPEGGVEEIARYGRPDRILLSNRHHLRHSERFADAFGCPIRCHEAGLWEFEDGGPPVQSFRFGDEVAPGITALEMGALTPEDTVFRLSAGPGALLFADGLVRRADGGLAFVPDWLMGDDPEGVKRGLVESLRRLLDEDFDALLFAHGEPMASGGRAALEAFVT
jgi:glyoxylase-like metal-dependent hydrolase (beta-lactamase superfamily II)